MSGTKNKKVTSHRQFEEMVSYLEEHTNLVTGCFNNITTKQSMQEGWHELSIRLNAEGPPVRVDEAWKKVWADLKNKIKKKIRDTQKDINKTGGGSRSVFLTPFEERVVTLTGIMESAVGTSGISLGHTLEDVPMSRPTTSALEIVEDGTASSTTVAPAPTGVHQTQRRRTTEFSKMYDEFKAQGRRQEEFQNSIISLMTEANKINAKRLEIEEARLNFN